MSMLDLLFLNFWFTGFSLIVLPTAVWVLVDASTLKVKKGDLGGGFFDMGVAGWFLSCLLLWIIAFPAYLAKRREYTQRLLSSLRPILSDSGYYKCPDCAELVREDARKCRFCGLLLPERRVDVTQQVQNIKEERRPAEEGHVKSWIGMAVGVLIILFILGSMALNRP